MAGGTLSSEKYHALAAITLCALAIEARANHLIDELVEKGLGEPTGRAAKWLPTKEKWFLLPALAGKNLQLDASKRPHQSIVQICNLRNSIMHVDFDGIDKRLPSLRTVTSYFKGFVEAMEDMNVILDRGVPNARKEVLALGKFS